MNRLLLAASLAVSLCSATTSAAVEPAMPAGFTALINGHDLTGWQDTATAAEHWKVTNGELINDGKVTVTLNGKVVMQDVPVEKGFDPPMRGPVAGPLRLQKSPHNVTTTFRGLVIRELQAGYPPETGSWRQA